MLNRWFLDPVLKGTYPEDILKLYAAKANLDIQQGDMDLIKQQRMDFLGVNYYSPERVKANPDSKRAGIESLPNPDKQPSFNGEAYPQGLYTLLVRIDRHYVDFETQQRIWKDSAVFYQSCIKNNGFDR